MVVMPKLEATVKVPKLKSMNLGGYEFLQNPSLGYYPWYSIELRQRIRARKVCNNIITAEAGIGKSYHSSDICRALSKRFDVEDIVFRYPEFLRAVLVTPRGTPIEFDEPSYAISKLDWFKEATKAIVKTIESFRFKGKPLFLPVINKNLLEKNVRSYMIQYHLVMNDRGKSTAYKIFPSQFRDKIYNYELCKLRYGLFDNNLCNKPSCLDCRKLDPPKKKNRCIIFRARYERKKITTQDARYKEALEEAEAKEYSKLSLDEIQAKILPFFDKFYDVDKDRLDINMIAIILKRNFETPIKIGHNKLYRLQRQIRFDHPELFERPLATKKELE